MTKVVLIYDNLLHMKILNKITYKSNSTYAYEEDYVDTIDKIPKIYNEMKPGILILAVQFNSTHLEKIIKSIHEEGCKIVVITKNITFRHNLFDQNIADRVFSLQTTRDELDATISELMEDIVIPSNEINQMIKEFNLSPYSISTKYFVAIISVAYMNPKLISQHKNNIYHSISEQYNVSPDTIRKSVYKTINYIYNNNVTTPYIRSIFGSIENLRNENPSRFIGDIIFRMKNNEENGSKFI